MSVDVVETDPVVLRETATRRLVFHPTIVERDQPLRGCFVYQRRGNAGAAWQDIREENLNSLKAGEGWVLELHTEEVAALLDGLIARKSLYDRPGIRWASACASIATASLRWCAASSTRRRENSLRSLPLSNPRRSSPLVRGEERVARSGITPGTQRVSQPRG